MTNMWQKEWGTLCQGQCLEMSPKICKLWLDLCLNREGQSKNVDCI